MGYKQPRVPEYRESEGVQRYMKPLILFLKDFSLASWKANNQRMREIEEMGRRLGSLSEIEVPVTSVNGQTGDVTLSAQDVGALGEKERAEDSACFAGNTWAQALAALHPVGSVYISFEETSPAALFGGTWERLEDVFLLGAGGAYAADERGGESETQLTSGHLPAHTHGQAALTGTVSSVLMDDGQTRSASGICAITLTRNRSWSGTSGSAAYRITVDASHTHQSVGGDEAHNNMPPYLAAYMWRRVA